MQPWHFLNCGLLVWDLRAKSAVYSFGFQYPVTSVCFSDSSDLVFVGGSGIIAWDVRMNRVQFSLSGHTDTITGIRLSPDGTRLLSSALDNTLRIWDVQPSFMDNSRTRILEGAPHGLKTHLNRPVWSKDGLMVGAGAGDGVVVIWNTVAGELVHKYTAHHARVNEVDFHPTESIVISCSSDKTLFLEEISIGLYAWRGTRPCVQLFES